MNRYTVTLTADVMAHDEDDAEARFIATIRGPETWLVLGAWTSYTTEAIEATSYEAIGPVDVMEDDEVRYPAWMERDPMTGEVEP